MQLTVSTQDHDKRLDLFLVQYINDLTRSHIQKAIRQGLVTVNGIAITKTGTRVEEGQIISFQPPVLPPTDLIPQEIKLDIVYEDKYVMVINKAAGMVVHPAAGNWEGTLANAVLGYLKSKDQKHWDGVDPLRLGIVHRLDKDTSGLLIVAKDDKTLNFLQQQFKNKLVEKRYYALVLNQLQSDEGLINMPIKRHSRYRHKFAVDKQGKEAFTYYKKLDSFVYVYEKQKVLISLLDVFPKTGRTHQIRVHLSAIGNPVLGDKVYGGYRNDICPVLDIHRQLLHAYSLEINLPQGIRQKFQIGFPQDMEKVISVLKG